ncbi:hypothetical protein OG601_46950 [Streptomyces sp. NBC_01239]|uniref:hypothetical protein n=1 Tax=Streptomyces sp. NBC_01239 TaxID=2903792 RepID=UPI00225B3F49|nr:hypothetical protein [Streptomyces sp. NBC_01239]MCX4809070.1 hypothetical protein [Streptomyces sp. NBC_01239]MCX4818113.1 hypothetical protein [Streptomyces sp. NBC_01239]
MSTRQIPTSPAHAAVLALSLEQLQQAAIHLWDALCAAHEEGRHQQQVLGGWDELNGDLTCDASKQRRRTVNDGWGLR